MQQHVRWSIFLVGFLKEGSEKVVAGITILIIPGIHME
jgi:hypothetical protein